MTKNRQFLPNLIISCLLLSLTVGWSALAYAQVDAGRARISKLFVSPEGNGSTCSQRQTCSLETAHALARTLASSLKQDLTIEIASGRYSISDPLILEPADSGQNGHTIRWQGPERGEATLDGARRIRNWVQIDSSRHVWKASLPSNVYSLQLFVNGERAVRARREGCTSPAQCKYSASVLINAGDVLGKVRHPEDIVAVFHVRWRDFHCGVERIEGKDLVMSQPCWNNTVVDSVKNGWSNASPKGKPFKGVEWFENAYEFLGTPGQFYIDRREHSIFYVPRSNESMETADVEMPITEHLLQIAGSSNEHVHDIEIRNIHFIHAGWNYEEHGEGYVPLQAGYLVTGVRHDLPDNGEGMQRIPAAVEIRGGERIAFATNKFSALGAAGIAFGDGTRDSSIKLCDFSDLSGGAIFVGDIVASPLDAKKRSGGIRISRNTITEVAKEYRDNVAIMGAFNDSLMIDHNTIYDLPYTGISVGWGWNYEGTGDVQRDIHIRSNRISHFMRTLHDGGAIYTQAQSPGSDVVENYIDYNGSGDGNGIYLDEHSRKYNVCGNVVWGMPKKLDEGHWLSAWASWSGDLKIHGNWSNDPRLKLHNAGPTKEFYDNHLALESLPPEALAVIKASGADGSGEHITDCVAPLYP